MADYEFTLSAFGLREPEGITWRRGWPWQLVAGAAGLAIFAALFVLSRRAAGCGRWRAPMTGRYVSPSTRVSQAIHRALG